MRTRQKGGESLAGRQGEDIAASIQGRFPTQREMQLGMGDIQNCTILEEHVANQRGFVRQFKQQGEVRIQAPQTHFF